MELENRDIMQKVKIRGAMFLSISAYKSVSYPFIYEMKSCLSSTSNN